MRRIMKNARVRAKCKLYQTLKKHARRPHISFHTPGHKNPKWDITELSYSDNLSCPQGVLYEVQKDVAQTLGAYKSFLLTDGSTCGVLSMLHEAKALGVKRILAREDAHKSLYNGCALLGLELLLLAKKEQNGIPAPFKMEDITKAEWEKADALFLTSPDYYGTVAPLQDIRKACDKDDKMLLIDGAHGGHLHFDRALYAGEYADLWVDGVHKSLPALTQAAVVSAKTEKFAAALERALDIFRTTSPSYPMMASIEYAVKYPRNERVENAAKAFATASDRVYFGGDWTKVCTLFGVHAFEAEKRLEEQGIYAEFCDGNVLCFYLSPAQSVRHIQKLFRLLTRLFKEYPYTPQKAVERIPAPAILPKNGVEWVDLSESVGRISASRAGLFPPCTPLVGNGEIITKETVDLLKRANNAFGLSDGKIAVYKKED